MSRRIGDRLGTERPVAAENPWSGAEDSTPARAIGPATSSLRSWRPVMAVSASVTGTTSRP